ncbi:MAG: hypothetical protein QXE90_03740 [Candidatus Micrarchaeia archaeon]
MFDDIYKKNIGFAKYYAYINKIFDLPIAEIIDKKHHGIIYFSKIRIESINFNFNSNETYYYLDPIEIKYTDLYEDKTKLIWKRIRKTNQDIYLYKKAIFNWLNKERVDLFSIIDYGPLSVISKEQSHVVSFDDAKNYIETSNVENKKAREYIFEHDFKNEINERLRLIRKILPKNKEQIKKSIIDEAKRKKFRSQN